MGISVIVPIYNMEKYLRTCIDSIISELYDSDELILVDDGSKDTSGEICDQYEHENTVIIHLNNCGVSNARNVGISRSSNEYILFVDADDYVLLGWRKEIDKALADSNGADIIYLSNAKNTTTSIHELLDNFIGYPTTSQPIVQPSVWWKLYKSSFIKENGIHFDENLINGEDSLFNIEALIKAEDYALCDVKNMYYYRPNEKSATHSFNERFNDSNIYYLLSLSHLISSEVIYSKSEYRDRIGFVFIQGLYLLSYRISRIKSNKQRKEKYILFLQKEYRAFYQEDYSNVNIGFLKKMVYKMIKMRRYSSAVAVVNLYNKASNLLRQLRNKRI